MTENETVELPGEPDLAGDVITSARLVLCHN